MLITSAFVSVEIAASCNIPKAMPNITRFATILQDQSALDYRDFLIPEWRDIQYLLIAGLYHTCCYWRSQSIGVTIAVVQTIPQSFLHLLGLSVSVSFFLLLMDMIWNLYNLIIGSSLNSIQVELDCKYGEDIVTTETFGFSGCIPQCDCHNNARYSEINYRFPQLKYQVWEAFCCKHSL